MKRKHRRLMILVGGLALLAVATILVITALKDSLVFFMSPTEIMAAPPPPDRPIRVGGLVEEGSVVRSADNAIVTFRITDLATTVPVVYEGVLPDLFSEGQGVVVEGWLGADGLVTAREVLAKHDENYMPPEVADAIRASGYWQGEAGQGEEETQP
ncbi:MAG: cytochrome c maturation protein CcmE [Dongiaceae bacterium]